MFDEDNHAQHPSMFAMMQQRQQQEARDYYELQMVEIRTAMESFMDGLSPEQCLNLSRMVQLFTNNPHYMHVVIGQLSTMMRVVHKICSSCGDSKHSTMEHLTATQPAMFLNAPSDYTWLHGLSPAEQMRRLNVTEDNETPGAFICYGCNNTFSTLFDRANQGRYCRICLSQERLNEGKDDMDIDVSERMFRYRVYESTTTEDGVYCIDCFTEFPTMKHRVDQGRECPVCRIQLEVNRDEGSAEPS